MGRMAFSRFSVQRSPGLSSRLTAVAALTLVLTGCGSLNLGVSLPIGRHTGVVVSVGGDGRIGVGVGASAGGGTVSVGTSGKLPAGNNTDSEASKP